MPDGEDVNSIFLKRGAEFFTQKIESVR
jgi:hypothetical protein